jgi:response regulator RpfG family c-di-GMP phosphodiesterase
MTPTEQRILLVDDEPAVLEGYKRLLHREFSLEVAPGGQAALTAIEAHGPFAVIVSDMRMPEMNGIELLTKVKSLDPNIVRIMLTGQADIETAIHAVNEGSIFRFLTKPASKEVLAKALTAGLVQYRLVTAEKELLERTLRGIIKVLTEVLSLTNPAAFSRAERLRGYVQHITNQLGLASPWKLEVAAMLSQLGCVTLDPKTIAAVYGGETLSREEQAQFDDHPSVARELLSKIPRLEPIAWIIAQQFEANGGVENISGSENLETIKTGALILRAAALFDRFHASGLSREDAIWKLEPVMQGCDPRIIQALRSVEIPAEEMEIHYCSVGDLRIGMILDQEIKSNQGTLFVAKGQEITHPMLLKLKGFAEKDGIKGPLRVLVRQARTGIESAGILNKPT